MQSIIEVAKCAARMGGDVITEGANNISGLAIEQKTLHDYVSEVDRNSEKSISRIIMDAFPHHQILGEEYGKAGRESNVQWVIDPLDGTTNFLRGVPHYAVSIGVMVDNELCHAVVFDPVKDEMFCASKGVGATLNDCPIKVSEASSLRGGLFATGVPFNGDSLNELECFTGTLIDVLNSNTSGIRRLGSAALDLAYVAAGRYDGYWEARLKIWDIAAGALLVSEAGGLVSDLQGRQSHLSSGNIIAAPSGAHNDLVAITSSNYPI